MNFPVVSGEMKWQCLIIYYQTFDIFTRNSLSRRVRSPHHGGFCQHWRTRRVRRAGPSAGRTGTDGSCWDDRHGSDRVRRSCQMYHSDWRVLPPPLHQQGTGLSPLLLNLRSVSRRTSPSFRDLFRSENSITRIQDDSYWWWLHYSSYYHVNVIKRFVKWE